MDTLPIGNGSPLSFGDYEFQAKQFQDNDLHGRASLKQVSFQNLEIGVGVLFYTQNDAQGRQRYEGQIKNGLPGKLKLLNK